MANKLTFFVPGKPQGKNRFRFTRNGRTYPDPKTKAYEQKVRLCAAGDAPKTPWKGPVSLDIVVLFREPKKPSHAWPAKPDLDNTIKVILDAVQKFIFKDDVQVVEIAAHKRYALAQEEEGVKVTVEAKR